MIRYSNVEVRYADDLPPVLSNLDLHIPEGELALVTGGTGAGKSTLLRAANGLVPHFSGGRLSGRVEVAGRSTADHRPRDLADVVGYVGQDPDATFVADIVEDELAYGMENLGVPAETMRRRVEDVLDLMNLHALRNRPIASLSGGQRQRVAIGAALTTAPRILVLDEPTSALDPVSAEEVLSVLAHLVHDQGVTILVAEHRLERVVHLCDRLVQLSTVGKTALSGPPVELLALGGLAPPVVELGRLMGWSPLPLSVRDARRQAAGLRADLADRPVAAPALVAGDVVAEVRGLSASYGRSGPAVLVDVDLDLREGETVALMGRNGSGKSTLLHHLVGLRAPRRGTVRLRGQAPHKLGPAAALRLVGLVPQDPGLLLGASSVAEECAAGDHDGRLAAGSTRRVLDRLLPGLDDRTHPRDLSEGQRLAVSLAVILAPEPPLILLDEPTRGLDYAAKARLVGIVADLKARGHAVLVATHDVELAAGIAERVVVLADGEIIADGSAREVVCHSPAFAPQVARILAPAELLTVSEVADALAVQR